ASDPPAGLGLDGGVTPGHGEEERWDGNETPQDDDRGARRAAFSSIRPASSRLFSSSPGLTRGSSPMPAEGGHPDNAEAGRAASLSGPGTRDRPSPPSLPDWVDQVPQANRALLLAMPEAVRAETLRVWARFYGFDT